MVRQLSDNVVTGGVPLVFVPVRVLLELIALKVWNPSLVNAQTLRRLFGTTRLRSRETVEEWAAEYDADRIDLTRLFRAMTERRNSS
jgi:hypothetical protein